MSFRVKLSSIARADREGIAEDLVVAPLPPKTKSDVSMGAAAPFNVWSVRPEIDELRLPIAYARAVMTDLDIPPPKGVWDTFPRRDLQRSLRQEQRGVFAEALAFLGECATVTLDLPTGFGKTIMAVAIAAHYGLKTAIIVPRGALSIQWKNAIETFGKLTAYEIPEPAKVKASSVARAEAANVIICLGQRATSPALQYVIRKVGTLVIDEAHLTCVPSYVEPILAFSPRYCIALSATLERVDGAQTMMRHVVGYQTVRRAPNRIYDLYVIHTGAKIRMKVNHRTGAVDYAAYESDLAESEVHNLRIFDLVVQNPTRKIILLFRLTRQATAMCDRLKEHGVEADIMLGARKSYRDCRVVCGTFSKISVGFDAANSAIDFDGVNPDTVVFCNTTKQWQLFVQSAGRAMRAEPGKTPVVVWIQPDTPIAKNHLKGIGEVAEARGGRFVDVPASSPPILSASSKSLDGERRESATPGVSREQKPIEDDADAGVCV